MKFWDASAVVALLVDEPSRKLMLLEVESDPTLTVWWGTRVECVSALMHRERDGSIDAASLQSAIAQLRRMSDEWHEILPTSVLRNVAERLLRVHVLRAADALQLAAALTAAVEDPASLDFVSLDQRLNSAASREGLRVV